MSSLITSSSVVSLTGFVALSTMPVPAPTVISAAAPTEHYRLSQSQTSTSKVRSANNSATVHTVFNSDLFEAEFASRKTSEAELVIGELRNFSSIEENWDNEGASLPSANSIRNAVSFVRLMNLDASMPETMLLPTGNTSLFWEGDDYYAELEFLEGERIAYFVKNNNDKHKGILSFDSKAMPAVFSTLIEV